MPTSCRVSGCASVRAGYSPFCAKHRSRKRRHGHEEQRTISKSDLKFFIDKVQARIAKQPEANLWSICDQRWDVWTSTWRSQPPSTIHRHVRAAAKELIQLADSLSGREVAITTIAMYLLQEYDPQLFKSEAAFRAQLARRVRSLSPSSYSEWGGASDGRKRRAMKVLDPRATEHLGGILVELFGQAGVRVAQLERKEEEERKKASLALGAALAEVA
jgi:hypothetical protein